MGEKRGGFKVIEEKRQKRRKVIVPILMTFLFISPGGKSEAE